MLSFKPIYSIIIVFLTLSLRTSAQNLKFDNYTTKDGLLSDEVYKIFQDKKGYIWLFTNYGVMKYNGKKFEQTLKNLPFNESFIYSYYENEKGQIWVANSNAKIYEIKNDSAYIVKGTETLSDNFKEDVCEILELFVDKRNSIYVVTKRGAYKLDKDKGYIAQKLFHNLAKDSIFVSVLDIEDHLISSIGYEDRKIKPVNGIFNFNLKYVRYYDTKFNYSTRFTGRNNYYNPTYFKNKNNCIYFLFYDNIIKLNSDHSIKYIPLNFVILNYTIDKNNHLWVGTYHNGLFELNENDSIVNHYLLGKTINHVLIDSENGLWASSDGNGLFHCKNMNEMHFIESDFFGSDINFIKKIDEKLFLANGTGDLYIISNENKIRVKNNDNEHDPVTDIIKYKSGYLVARSFYLNFMVVEKNIINTKLPLIKPDFYPFKFCNFSGDTILCLSRNRMLILTHGISDLTNEKQNEILNLNHKILDFSVSKNQMLFATDDGVYSLLNNILTQPYYLLPTKKCKIVNITKDIFDNYWFCSKGYGLFKLTNKNELSHYTIQNNLPSNIINNISFMSDHSILLSTNRGLFRSSNFDKWDELYSEQTMTALEFGKDIYLTSKNGLVVIKKDTVISQKSIYFNLISVYVNSKLIPQENLNELKFNQNNLEFNFDVISFSKNIPNVFYRLEGDKKYTGITNTQQVIFQNLSPGNYTLTASLVVSKSHTTALIIPFCIKPAFWQTLWFKVGVVVLALLVFVLIVWQVFRYLKRKDDKKNEINKLITEYKLIALKAQINPHFMSNCLTAIQHLIISNKVDEANQYLAKFSLLVRQVLNFSTKPLVLLKEELHITEINIELEQLRFENRFLFEIIIQEKLNLSEIYVPPLILQPIIENAIWHGLLPLKKEKNGKLLIQIFEENNLLYIVIEDNGVGRQKIKNDFGNIRESKGIEITKQRIHNLNDYYNSVIKANLIYTDLIDIENNPIGTKVTIVLPLNLNINEEE